MRIGVLASELYRGGEVRWTEVLTEALCGLESVQYINLYTRIDYEFFGEYFKSYPKIFVKKIDYVLRFDTGFRRRLKRLLLSFRNPVAYRLFKLEKIFKENDLLICPYLTPESVICGLPYVVLPQDLRHKRLAHNSYGLITALKQRIADHMYNDVLAHSEKIVVEADSVRQDLMQYYGVEQGKIEMIVSPPGKNFEGKQFGFEKEKLIKIKYKYKLPDKYVFYPAHLIRSKNHIPLIEAMSYIKSKYKTPIFLTLVGSMPDEEYYRELMKDIAEKGLYNDIKYLGYVPNDEIPYLYTLSTMLVIPTLFESVSLPIWEAFFTGVPVVSSNVCGLPEQVGSAGLLFDPRDIDDMAEKIYAVWSNDQLRDQLINKGRERIKGLTLENYAFQWEQIINEALA